MYDVDWEKQWEAHAPGYKDGALRVPLNAYNGPAKELILHAGGGFGDLSHPTTRLALKLLLPLCPGQHIIDIGCGSGILSLAALAAGATSALAIDIAPEAIEHTRKNALLNNLPITLKTPDQVEQLPQNTLIVMNMISSEQDKAWNSLPTQGLTCTLITAGILADEQEQAFARYKNWGFRIYKTCVENNWLAYLLKK